MNQGVNIPGATVTGNTVVNGYTVPVDLTVNSRTGTLPSEYVASSNVEFSGEFESTVSDEFVAYISDAGYAGTGNLGAGLSGSGGSYRYGFNGKENDNEVKGIGNQIDFGARIYDSRVGRFLTLDPYAGKFAWSSPYSDASNNPIKFVDVNGASTGDPTPKYVYDKLKVNLANMPESHTMANGQIRKTSTRTNGIRDNAAWYWDQVRQNDPSTMWSKGNTYRMDNGISPVADAEFVRQFPAFEEFKGQTLEMHHINQKNGVGIGLPRDLHRGAGFTKLWHNAKVAGAFFGTMLTLYQQSFGQDPLLVGDLTKPQLQEDEMMMVSAGMGQNDYQKASHFAAANNSRTGQMKPGTIGIYYASQDEMANFQFLNLSNATPGTFIIGGWGAYYQNVGEASRVLNKKVTHAVIFFQQNGGKGFAPVNAIQLMKPEEVPSNKAHSTLSNKMN